MEKEKLPMEEFDAYWIYAHIKKENIQFPSQNNSPVTGSSGKWLIFEHFTEINNTWKKIKEATEKGMFGTSSKCSTAKLNPRAIDADTKVICVYTYDFCDVPDVDRIEKAIRDIGIENKLIYKLNKDVGRISKDGHKNISQKVSYSKKFFEILDWLNQHVGGNFVKKMDVSPFGKQHFLFERHNLTEEEFALKKIFLSKIGFWIEETENKNPNSEVIVRE